MSNWYNFTNVTQSRNLLELAQAINELVNHWWGIGVLFSFFMVIFVVMVSKRYPTRSALPAALAMTCFASLFLRTLSLIPDLAVILCVFGTIFSMLYMLFVRY